MGNLVTGARGGALALCLLGALLAPAPAIAESLSSSGSLDFTWQASPALGCAALRLCGVHGAVTITPQGADSQAVPGTPTDLALYVTAAARTQGPGPTSCVDLLNVPEVDLAVSKGVAKVVTLGPGGASSGRCSGPLAEDLARLAIPVRTSGGRHPTWDLRGSRSISAGPYSLRVDSTLQLRPEGGGSPSSSSAGGLFTGSFFGGGGPGGSNRARKRLLEDVVMRYRVAPAIGALQASFHTAPEPFCETLGACGTTGTLSITLAGAARPLTIEASRFVRRRFGRARVLADLRAGKLSAGGQGYVGATVTETLQSGGSVTCTDTRAESLPILVFGGGHNSFMAGLSDNQFEDSMRTYCPGPIDGDVLSGGVGVAQGAPFAGALGEPGISLTLSQSGNFSGPAYGGSWRGGLTLALSRVGIRAQTRTVRG